MKYIMIALALLIAFIIGDALHKVDRPAIPSKVIELFHKNTVVVSHTIDGSKRAGLGTGIWVDRWHILTACHVQLGINRTEREHFAINHDETEVFRLTSIACNEGEDIALYRADWPNVKIKPIKVNWVTPPFGTEVYSAGYHHNLPLSAKVGYMGGASRQRGAIKNYISMSIGTGDSGSPIFNKHGELIGIVLAIYSTRTKQGELVQLSEISFAATGYSIHRLIEENIYEQP